jgi:CRP/FNR family transcriptional regulator, cyclic AMP receptor protein
MPTDSALLADIPLFALLDENERATLAAQLDVVEQKAGTLLFRVGDPGDALYIVRRGEVEIFVQNDTGDRIVLAHTQAGEMTGELSLLDGGPRTASALVSEDIEALRLDRGDLNQFLLMCPSAAMDLLAGMGQRLRANTELLRHTATRNVNEEMEDKRTTIQKAADWIADFSGSIPFLLLHILVFAVWILLNVGLIPILPSFDPFPFGLLTMIVSLEAIVLSVFVLLSQNRQAAKERIRADIEYDVNLKAELEVAHLHVKVDQLHAELLARLDAIEHGRQPV